jgi:hypothetical protein
MLTAVYAVELAPQPAKPRPDWFTILRVLKKINKMLDFRSDIPNKQWNCCKRAGSL